METVTLPSGEILIWLGLSTAGLITRLLSLRLAQGNYNSMRINHINGIALALTSDLVLSEQLSSIGWLGFVVVGVLAAVVPQPASRFPATAFGTVLLVALLVGLATLFAKNVVDYRISLRIRHEGALARAKSERIHTTPS